MKVMRAISTSLFLLIMLLIATPAVHAQEPAASTYTVQYDFEFYPNLATGDVNVTLNILLTNLRSDVYINEYNIRFPKNVLFKNLKVSDDAQSIPYVVSERSNTKQITFKFSEPETATSPTHHIRLSYTLDEMIDKQGSATEIVLPLLIAVDQGTVNATLHLPENFEQIASIAKPIPTEIAFRTIKWTQVDAKTLYVLFGNSRTYELKLDYSLQNTGLTPAKKTVALPPETLYQKVYISSIEPKPDSTYTDVDGNFIAEFTVKPRRTLDIAFTGFVEVFAKPQATMREVSTSQYKAQRNNLLTEKELWSLKKSLTKVPLQSLKNARDVFNYVVDTLEYSPQRLNSAPKRLGAAQALEKPDEALCMEYSDVFVALAREKGIAAREIQGYAYSESNTLRPQSLARDVLHSWSEYYNPQQELWYPVDPTWSDTSSIDYFNSFDVNHIALAIHGDDPTQPLPAGFYKTSPKQDVKVTVSERPAFTVSKISITHDIPSGLEAGKDYDAHVTVTNEGNTFIHTMHVVPQSRSIEFNPAALQISYLAPFESRELPITLSVSENYSQDDTITFTHDGKVLGAQDVRVNSNASFDATILLFAGAGTLLLILVLYYLRSRSS